MQAVAEKRVAYDLSRFDRRMIVREQIEKERTAQKAKTKTVAKKKSKHIVSPFSVFCSVVVFVMLTAMLFSYVGLTEASDINRKKKNELESLREEVQMLEISKNQRMGSLKVRDYAVNNLGMSKIDKSQITYVTTSGGDRFETCGNNKEETGAGLIAGLAKGFSSIIEYIN